MPRRDRNEPAAFWRGWVPGPPSPVRSRQLGMFVLPEPVTVPRGEVQARGGWWYCSEGHRHRLQEVAARCEAKRGE